jgi:hypothetical protein
MAKLLQVEEIDRKTYNGNIMKLHDTKRKSLWLQRKSPRDYIDPDFSHDPIEYDYELVFEQERIGLQMLRRRRNSKGMRVSMEALRVVWCTRFVGALEGRLGRERSRVSREWDRVMGEEVGLGEALRGVWLEDQGRSAVSSPKSSPTKTEMRLRLGTPRPENSDSDETLDGTDTEDRGGEDGEEEEEDEDEDMHYARILRDISGSRAHSRSSSQDYGQSSPFPPRRSSLIFSQYMDIPQPNPGESDAEAKRRRRKTTFNMGLQNVADDEDGKREGVCAEEIEWMAELERGLRAEKERQDGERREEEERLRELGVGGDWREGYEGYED